MSHENVQQRRLNATPRGVGVMCQFMAATAENATITDTEGKTYTDFAAGIAVLNTGHRHPKVIAAAHRQLDLFTHTAFQVVPYENYISLAERLNDLVPIDGEVKTTFFTTGAEAVENAVKIARAATGRPGVITFTGAFHGRTLLTMALTGKVAPYKTGFGPFPGSVFHARYPNALHGVSVDDALQSLDDIFHCDIAPQQVAAIIYEPVQGEGGFNVAPAEFVNALRSLCDQHGILLIADEIQSGFARTGKMFASEYYPQARPDLMTMAKSLGGGFPISAVAGRAELMDAPAPGGLGGTYAGNPVAIATAHAVLDVIAEEQLAARANTLGATLCEAISGCHNPAVAQIRGRGSMIAVEFNDPQTGAPAPEVAKDIQQRALDQQLILLTCGIHGNVIRFLYPLTIPDAQFASALNILTGILKSPR
ncbi:4-aminobutyrate--2-oxoglutarate transaminase [Shimwellia blattae]|uniref:4-aminobutyrate transaminase n=1 Tax=Shimwellia blattae (strain ATCC 29907 / DSM 4481 / JCM 1650 / NBRC 105725 / CDC 9005-74) TaxID=630626 RepID=I2B4K5_SHIBC|nr:4-aminobutyrate--2-oxoglutarate transaminase [Shimwellia blattae]AFJ45459.1 4-aminobutyrate transaminase [Shimwellia blattae DSM 4481 = NBRC 105725]GAB81599.1 4-aminobutyrate aminotransferase PuuE [Shimwellia blattae DSM 4481 = NBRC 105725]VDY62938.1 4-aminobutyrate aminotransferase PuuE [Shimwellia blattae]VEC19971.1 4-aminobutyrate aminotransferase PuuE [Shimwellia blattae]